MKRNIFLNGSINLNYLNVKDFVIEKCEKHGLVFPEVSEAHNMLLIKLFVNQLVLNGVLICGGVNPKH